MATMHYNVGEKMTLGLCMQYHSLGLECQWNDGKDLTLIDRKKANQDGNPERHKSNISKKSISQDSSANKNNYSTVCLRCGRKLRSEVSRTRGYGSYCYKKIGEDEKHADIEEQSFIEKELN